MAYKTIVVYLLLIFITFGVKGQIDTPEKGVSDQDKGQDSLLVHLTFTIDSLIENAISHQAFPGCVVFASQNGQPFYKRRYGYHTYDSIREVRLTDLYDLASLSKTTGAMLALMKLYEWDLFDLDESLKEYVTGFNWDKRGRARIRDILTHQAGFQGWIKYYEKISLGSKGYRNKTIRSHGSEEYDFPVADHMFLHKDFYRKIKKYIKRSPFNPDQGYKYSDLFFYLVPEIVKRQSGMEYQEFLKYHFYDSLEAGSLCFNPDKYFDLDRVVPTEIDTFFRMEKIHGKVHDEGAILMHGVSGHAGLFSNVEDLARVWQMLLNRGTLDGKIYLEPATIELFTSYQFPQNENRRGLGFDKPLLEYDPVISSISAYASVYSYGHTGFTGPIVWADPLNDFLFIFLTNRVYPSRENKAIYDLNLRPELHQLFYQYLQNSHLNLKKSKQ